MRRSSARAVSAAVSFLGCGEGERVGDCGRVVAGVVGPAPSRSGAEHMAEALVSVPRRFVASTATSSSQWVLSPAPRAELRRARLAAAAPPGRPRRLKAHAAVGPETGEQPKWWEKNAGPNMIDIHSTQEFLDALRDAGDRLVIVEFYGTWCGSCRALFPRFQKLKDAIAVHNTDRCSIGPPVGVGNVLDSSSPREKPAEATS